MSAFSGGYDKVNGAALAGEFLSGSLVFYTVATIVPMFQTNVTTPVAFLYTQQGYATWQPVTVIDGTGTSQTYNTQTAYQDAYNKQANFDYLVKAFSTRANPVILNITQQLLANPSTTTAFPGYSYQATFGSSYTTANTVVSSVTFTSERGSTWLVSGTTLNSSSFDTNAAGYQLLDTLNAFPNGVLQDLSTPVLTPGFVEFVTDPTSVNCNTIAIISASYNSAP